MTAARWNASHRKINRTLALGRRANDAGWPRLSLLVDLFNRIVFSADIPSRMHIPDDVTFMHNGLGTVVDERVVFTGRAMIFQHVTLGFSFSRVSDGAPTIGHGVTIGAGAGVFGPVRVGDSVFIAANMVVSQDVPAHHKVHGQRAQVSPRQAKP